MTLDQIASEVLTELQKSDDKKQISPETILLIIQIVIAVVKLYRACNKTSDHASRDFKSLGFINRWKFRRLIKSHTGPEVYKQIGTPLYAAFTLVASKLPGDIVDQIFKEIT